MATPAETEEQFRGTRLLLPSLQPKLLNVAIRDPFPHSKVVGSIPARLLRNPTGTVESGTLISSVAFNGILIYLEERLPPPPSLNSPTVLPLTQGKQPPRRRRWCWRLPHYHIYLKYGMTHFTARRVPLVMIERSRV